VKQFEEWGHSALGMHLGFAADASQSGNKGALDPTVGFLVSGDFPVGRYVLLGPLVQFGAWHADFLPTSSRNYTLDLDFAARARLPVTSSWANYQVWVGVPLGLTLDFLGQEQEGVPGAGLGWNLGILYGGAIHVHPKYALFAEAGFAYQRMSHRGDQVLDFRLGQWTVNFGTMFRN
jgi:hypothetical protein